MLDETPLTPDWWLITLGRRLRDRQAKLDRWHKWATEQPLPAGPRRASQAYLDFQRSSRTNFLATVADASVFRMVAIGVADAQGRSDDEAWRWWQLNRMDARQRHIYSTMTRLSASYVMVGRHPQEARRPLITVEHPREVIVDTDPETGERRAALKSWYDPILRRGRANVMLRDDGGTITKYQTITERGHGSLPWSRNSWQPMADTAATRLGVPIVEFPCRPELGEDPVAEFDGVIDIQARINLGMLNRMTVERYGAFRQKYVTGHRFKKRTDPETGLELLDPITRKPQVEQPFQPDPGSLWASEGENTKFGEFSQTELSGYLAGHKADIMDLLIISHTPAYYYSGDMINIGSDTIQALDMLHLAKISEHLRIGGEGLEEALGLAALVAGVDRDFAGHEIRWMDPRQLNPSILADMGTKLTSIGYPLAVVAERLGESPAQVARITAAQAADAFLSAVAQQQPQQALPQPANRGTQVGGAAAGNGAGAAT